MGDPLDHTWNWAPIYLCSGNDIISNMCLALETPVLSFPILSHIKPLQGHVGLIYFLTETEDFQAG